MDSSILDLTEQHEEDTKIKSMEAFPFLPITGTQYNTPAIIRIDIENQDEFFYPHDSWLEIEGRLLKNNNNPYGDDDQITITNNGIMYLFSNIKYILGGNEIESLGHCGHATTMLGMARYSNSFNNGPGLSQGWCPDTSTGADANNTGFTKRRRYFVTSPDQNGYFSIPIHLDHILGFTEDYNRVIYGMRHTFQMTRRANDADAIFRGRGVDAGKIVLSKITWWMPRVAPSEPEVYKLYKQIGDNKLLIDCAFRMRQCASIDIPAVMSYTWNLGVRTAPEKPRYIIIGFQSGKADNQEANAALFDHCNVTNMKVRLNSTEYPSSDFNANFARNNYAGFYMNMVNFVRQYYGVDRMVSSTSVDALDYKNLFPLYFFDVTKQSERLNQGVVDISVQMNFSANAAANTKAYALLISDRYIKFQSDGRKMSVVF